MPLDDNSSAATAEVAPAAVMANSFVDDTAPTGGNPSSEPAVAMTTFRGPAKQVRSDPNNTSTEPCRAIKPQIRTTNDGD